MSSLQFVIFSSVVSLITPFSQEQPHFGEECVVKESPSTSITFLQSSGAGLVRPDFLWPINPSTGKVQIRINCSDIERKFSKKYHALIHQVLCDLYTVYPCISIVDNKFSSHLAEYIAFEPIKGKCQSPIGRQPGNPTVIDLDEAGCGYKQILHEIFHAIGFDHEHCRPDRDNYVSIQWANINKTEEHNFKITANGYVTQFTQYDYRSVMHYGLDAFSNNTKPTIEVKKTATSGKFDELAGAIGAITNYIKKLDGTLYPPALDFLSGNDVLKLKYVYPCNRVKRDTIFSSDMCGCPGRFRSDIEIGIESIAAIGKLIEKWTKKG